VGGTVKEYIGNALGQLKIERSCLKAEFFAPKMYRLIDESGNKKFASKGFPVNEQDFNTIIAGEAVLVERMQLLKRQFTTSQGNVVRLRRGYGPRRNDNTFGAGETADSKRWAGISKKRKPYADGSTRPWTVQEIDRGEHESAVSPLFKGDKQRVA